MKTAAWAISLITILCVGCSSVSQMIRLEAYDLTAAQYAKAVRWSDFDSASSFLQGDDLDQSFERIKKLKRIKVTDYRVKKFEINAEKDKVSQLVEINYYTVTNPTLKSTLDHQRWEYDSLKEQWYLVSGLPQFK